MSGVQLSDEPLVIVMNRIKAARMQTGLSMRQLATKANLSPATVCRCEDGKEPSLENALKLSKALGYPVEELWYLSGPQKEESKP